MCMLEVDDVRLGYVVDGTPHLAVDGVSFTVPRGSTTIRAA
ncbi:hypothetical protein [Nocardioides sp. NPDC047086]